jgi:hypothetical protein
VQGCLTSSSGGGSSRDAFGAQHTQSKASSQSGVTCFGCCLRAPALSCSRTAHGCMTGCALSHITVAASIFLAGGLGATRNCNWHRSCCSIQRRTLIQSAGLMPAAVCAPPPSC